jgi:two-component system, sensor histidine kinase and response regulator
MNNTKEKIDIHALSHYQQVEKLLKSGHAFYDIGKHLMVLSDEAVTITGLKNILDLNQLNLETLIYKDDLGKVNLDIQILFDQHILESSIYRMIVDHKMKYVELCAKTEMIGKQMTGILIGIRDVTPKIELQINQENYRINLENDFRNHTIELEKSRETADQASMIKTTFLSNMSHEIRTPMNAIVGYTHLLSQITTDPIQMDYLEKIGEASDHLLTIINDILDFSKLEAGKVVIEHLPFKLDKLLSSVQSIVIHNVKKKNLYLDIQSVHVPNALIGDENRIRQILINLLSNAVKFTETGGISLTCILDSSINENNIIVSFKIKDTGIGMTKKQMSKLFKDFEQADSSTTRLYGGTGLGLSISYRLSQLMSGDINVESRLNEGSEFIFRLPLGIHMTDANQAEIEEVYSKPKEGSSILLAEDNLLSQKLSQRILNNMKMSVTVADNGLIALNLAQKNEYDLIILDIQMPLMDGITVAKEIRKFNQKTPILAMTANAFSEDRETCIAVGMNDFISKPIDPKSLHKALSRWIPET